MGYYKLKLRGDGDCFFHGVAAFELERDGVLPAWTGQGQATFGDPYRAKELRRMVASAGVESIFPTWNLEALNALFTGIASPSDVNARIGYLPDPAFTGAVTETSFLEALPKALHPSWKLNPGERRRIAAFFLYWYQYSQMECETPEWIKTSAYFGYNGCDGCIVGDIDLNTEGHQQHSGFASHLIYDLTAINLIVVRDGGPATDPNTLAYLAALPARVEGASYLVNRGGYHFDAALWFDGPNPFAFVNNHAHQSEQSETTRALSRPFADVSRRVNNSRRGSLRLGVGVWNINHLGETPSVDNSEQEQDVGMVVEKTKNELKVEAVEQLVARNLWLDIFTLNEVNNVTGLEGGQGYEFHAGPHLISETESGGSERKGQHEYYPLLICQRAKRDFSIQWGGCFCVDSKGQVRPSADKQELRWTKEENVKALTQLQESRNLETFATTRREDGLLEKTLKRKRTMSQRASESSSGKIAKMFEAKDVKSKSQADSEKPEPEEPKEQEQEHCVYRPVVVHQLLIGGDSPNPLQVNVGIIHTTPQGTEFERWKVYQQLNQFFDGVGTPRVDCALQPSIPVYWIILGDFYLFGESRVTDQKDMPVLSDSEFDRIYSEEVQFREELAEKIGDSQEKFYRIHQELVTIIKSIEAAHWALPFRLRKAGNHKTLDPHKKYSTLLKECDADTPGFLAHDAKEPPSKNLWELASEVDKLLQSRLPFDDGRSWAEWWASVVPVCFRDAADELERSGIRDGYCGQAWEELRGWLEKIEATRNAGDRITLIAEAVGAFNYVQKCLGDLWQPPQPKSKKEAKQGGDDGEGEAHEPPLEYFNKNRAASAKRLNRFRNVLGGSFEAMLRRKFQVLHTIWGTNIHGAAVIDTNSKNAEPKVEYSSFRIADFAVCSKEWQSCELGLFHHERPGLIRVDDKSVTTTVYWRALSDHFPIGGVFSLGASDRAVKSVFIEEDNADYIEARNVMYLQDILEGLYLFQEKPASWSHLSDLWPKQAPESSGKEKEKVQEQRNPGSNSPYAEAFETRKNVLLKRLTEFPNIDPGIAKRIASLTVGDDSMEALLDLIREFAQKFPLRVSRAAASGGIWADGQPDQKIFHFNPISSFTFEQETKRVEDYEYAESGEFFWGLPTTPMPPTSTDPLSADYVPEMDWSEWDAHWNL